jgi:hypothetical protein
MTRAASRMHRCAVSSVSATRRRRCGWARSRRSYCSIARLPRSNSRRPRRNFPVRGALHHAVMLQNHQKAVRGALVQLQGRGYLRQSQRHIALAQQIQIRQMPGPGPELYSFLAGLRLAYWSSIPFARIPSVSRTGTRFLSVRHINAMTGNDSADLFRSCSNQLSVSGTTSPSPGARNRFASSPCWRV